MSYLFQYLEVEIASSYVFVKLFTFEIPGTLGGFDTLYDSEANCCAFKRCTVKTNRQKLYNNVFIWQASFEFEQDNTRDCKIALIY